MSWVAVAIAGGAAIGKVAWGAHQQHHGNKLLREAEANRPKYNVNPILQNNANFGFGQQATNYYTENINRGLGSGINAILQGGGDINMINSLVGGATNAYKQYAIADAQQKLANQGALVNDQRAAWDYNSNIPFQQKYYRSVQQTNAGAQNVAGGFQDLSGAVASMGGMGGKQEGGTNAFANSASNQMGNYYQQRSQMMNNPYASTYGQNQNPYATNPLTSSWYNP